MNWQSKLQRLIEILETSEIDEIEVGFWGQVYLELMQRIIYSNIVNGRKF